MKEYTVEVYDDGDKYWYLNGKRHRENDLPAIEFANGYKAWYINGKRHRETGAAIEDSNGTKYWYLNGIRMSEEEFDKRMNPTKELTVAEISKLLGYDIKIVKG
jgi:antitoxin component YwqK of YwqJK toxin-antitoxin module